LEKHRKASIPTSSTIKEGYFGYTVKGEQQGDQVCLIASLLLVLHVVREVKQGPNGQQQWKLIGDSYVNSLMHGEVDESGLDERDIILV
jgi:hypothetical protein